MQTAVILGGAGFLGSHLCDRFLKEGMFVHCVDNLCTGRTENIEVRSIVGRYLEHGRVYFFGAPERMRVYLGSADFMPRNTVKRVEICAPVKDAALRKRLYDEFRLQFDDPVKARCRTSDGDYHLPEGGNPAENSQEALHRAAYARAHEMEHSAKSSESKKMTHNERESHGS